MKKRQEKSSNARISGMRWQLTSSALMKKLIEPKTKKIYCLGFARSTVTKVGRKWAKHKPSSGRVSKSKGCNKNKSQQPTKILKKRKTKNWRDLAGVKENLFDKRAFVCVGVCVCVCLCMWVDVGGTETINCQQYWMNGCLVNAISGQKSVSGANKCRINWCDRPVKFEKEDKKRWKNGTEIDFAIK